MIRTLPKILISALLYFLLGETGLFLTVYQGYASPIYPAAALGLIAVLQGGERYLTAIWLGSFAIKMEIALRSTGITTNAVLLGASISVGACIQAWVSVLLIRHFLKNAWQSLIHDSDIFRFFLLAGPLSCMISATWAMLSLYILERIQWVDVPFTWWNWWIGDVLGIILFAPVLLTLLYRQWQPWRQRLKTILIPTLLFTITIVTVFLYIAEKDQKLLKYRIDSYGVELVNLIDRQLLTYQETVESLARLLEIAPDLSRADFDKFTRPIFNKHSDINALSWNPWVTYEQRSLFETHFADENALADFKIKERDENQQLVIAKPRDWYVVVGYIGPIESNSKALGYDVASNKERLQAVNVALLSKQLTATPPIRLVQETNNTTGLLLLQPVYGKTARQGNDVMGFAVGVFKIEAMLRKQVLEQLPEGLLFSLEDINVASENRWIYRNNDQPIVNHADYSWTARVDFAGRQWQMKLEPTYAFLSQQRSISAWLVLVLGLFAIGCMQIMLLGVTGRNYAIQRRVDQQTQEIAKKNAGLLENERQLIQKKERYETFLHASGDGIHIIDEQGILVEANQRFCDLLGYSMSELLGKSVTFWDALYSPESAFVKVKENFTQTNLFETKHRCKNGELIDVEVSAQTVIIEGKLLLWNSSRDIGERKRLLQELTKAKETAEHAVEIKSKFLANMSHEIRTPMNGILGLTQLALMQDMNADLRVYLDKILQSSQMLLSILNGILDISKIEAGRMTLEYAPFDLDALLTGLQNLYETSVHEKNLSLTLDIAPETPLYLLGDALRLQQVLSNLLGNAIKFTDVGKVTLAVRLQAYQGDQVRLAFSVTDTGIGIDQAQKAMLFLPFNQVDNSISRRFGGTGLGLAICRELLALMGSDIHVDSVLGKGSCFSFEVGLGIPVSAKSQEKKMLEDNRQRIAIPSAASNQQLAGYRILVAEDNTINQLVVGKFLKLMGVQYEIASNGQLALDYLAKQTFDAVLMDVSMPVMDGLEATRQIRLNPQWQQLPVIAFSAGITDDERKACEIVGMTDFISKPINPEVFVATLSRWLS